ncbi:SidA/IucD/PvdA family monooxygenase [Rhodococcus sp. 14-2483-1-2]|uniref:lysine N(6)-hydroxylase/L-ornithine N(5)-oxygenase family protein n=1 Tax=Rhodococcus sp. 14-2483-1-2 TaxID=2023147 RepID=UPI000B9C6E4B|nr:SidA/IucD/PvdA family monooxygenase [Rhodococcus sp. 14-2483-1-2]OZF26148.1 L-lysine 6-monooxygenase [Rhodococcus sp. 14-2483-1-2]
MSNDGGSLVDVVGIGFGPSNLALAIAIEEYNQQVSPAEHITAQFLEKQSRFGWHRGMLLPGTTMQVSFLKDLATQRNASSPYSFLNYLASRGRLTHFINRQSFFPTRLEFHDYLTWAAAKVQVPVAYGSEVTSVECSDGVFEARTGQGELVRGRMLVLAGGLTAKIPSGINPGRRVFHNHRLLERLQSLPPLQHQRFVVVGSGQSAAEVAAHLHENYPRAEIHAVLRKYGYTPADDSPYANRIFDPEAVDEFHSASTDLRQQLLDYHRGTNYSAVDLDLINDLYRREYEERVSERRRLFVQGASTVEKVAETEAGVAVTVKHGPSRESVSLDCDAVVLATGFRPTRLIDLLGPLTAGCDVDANGRPVIGRDYRVAASDGLLGPIYVQGDTEQTHGLSSTLLSNLAVRSGELVSSMVKAKSHCPPGNVADKSIG